MHFFHQNMFCHRELGDQACHSQGARLAWRGGSLPTHRGPIELAGQVSPLLEDVYSIRSICTPGKPAGRQSVKDEREDCHAYLLLRISSSSSTESHILLSLDVREKARFECFAPRAALRCRLLAPTFGFPPPSTAHVSPKRLHNIVKMRLSPDDLVESFVLQRRDPFFLERRDVCTDAFGNGSYSQTCAPTTLSNTLCCKGIVLNAIVGGCNASLLIIATGLNTSSTIPFCHSQIGYGFCCAKDGGCYKDINNRDLPACSYSNSTRCGAFGTQLFAKDDADLNRNELLPVRYLLPSRK